MFRNKKIIVLGLAIVALIAVAGVTMAVAQEPDPVNPDRAGIDRPFQHWRWPWQRLQKIRQGREIMDEALADALDITVDELQSAREEARLVALDRAVEEGLISEKRANLMRARAAVLGSIDKEELLAQALGITEETLQAAREEGTTLPQLIEELGLTPADVRSNLNAFREATIEDAEQSGLITAEQAELLREYGLGLRPFRFPPRSPQFRGQGNNAP